MAKKKTECIGGTRGQIEALIVVLATQQGYPPEAVEVMTPDTLVTMGILRRCTVHPGMYLSGTFGNLPKRLGGRR